MNDMLKTVLVLSIIAVIAGALLGLVNSFTQVDEEEQLKSKLSLVYDNSSELTALELNNNPSINPGTDLEISAAGYVDRVFTAPDGTYVMLVVSKGGYKGEIKMLFAIKEQVITKMAVYSHSETPGLGSVGFEDEYLANYIGKNISEIDKFTVTKGIPSNESEIKTVTGATYTSNAIVTSVNVAAYWYNLNGPYAVAEG
jgi:electron transport complex protein RnfG